MSQLALSASFEYVCYGSTAIIICFSYFGAGIDYVRHILTSKDGPRTERFRVNPYPAKLA